MNGSYLIPVSYNETNTVIQNINDKNDDKQNENRFWILIDNINSNKLIIKNTYILSNFDNFFSGPFDNQIELINFLENLKDINYEIEFQ